MTVVREFLARPAGAFACVRERGLPRARTGDVDLVIVSRCAWTLSNFRRNLMRRTMDAGLSLVALGAELEGYGARLKAEGIDWRHVGVPTRGLAPLGDLRLFLQLWRRFRNLRPRVAHMFTIKPVIYGTLAAALAGVPQRLCTITGLGHAFTDGGAGVRWIAEILYRLALAQAHRVFFQNREDMELFIRRGLVSPAKAELVAGSGVDLVRFTPAPFAEGLGRRPVRFLMLSRLVREKGVIEYLQAAELAAGGGLSAEFRLTGAWDERNPTGLRPADLAPFDAGPVERRPATVAVEAEIAWADVVVLPSYREGAPRALLEAMAMGRPVITTDAPGCRSLVRQGENGLLVPVRDAAALAGAMAGIAGDPGRLMRMGAAGRAFVEAEYDEAAVIARTLAAYEETTS